MTWLAVVPLVLVTLLALFVPGLAATAPLRLRWLPWLAIAAPVSVAAITFGGIISGATGLRWGLLPVLIATALLAALAFGLRLATDRVVRRFDLEPAEPAPTGQPRPWWTLGGLAVGAVGFGAIALGMIGRPDAFSQTFDNIFHLNAIRWILDTGNASSTAFHMTSAGTENTYYPLGWHDTIALVLQLTGRADPVLGTNAMILAVGAVVWPLSCLLLTQSIVRPGAIALLGTGALSVSAAAHPFLLLHFGVLYPNWLALCMAPAVLGLLVQLLRLAPDADRAPLRQALPAAGLAGIGTAAAHPNITLTLLAIGVVLVAAWALAPAPDHGLRPTRRGRLLIAAATAVLIGLLWLRLRPPADAGLWQATRTFPEGLGEAILVAPVGMPINLAFAAVVSIGCYLVLRTRRNWWLLGAHLLLVFLWLFAGAGPSGRIREMLIGVYYSDPFRLAALLPLTAIPLGVLALHHYGEALVERFADRAGDWLRPVVAIVITALLGGVAFSGPIGGRTIADLGKEYRLTNSSPLVNANEYALLMRVRDLVPADAVIATNPWNGSSMVYALTGHPTTTTHVLYEISPEVEVINQELDELADNPAVCPVVRELDVRYVLDFGTREVHGQRHPYLGFDDLAEAPGFKLIAEEGRARLYEVTGCW